jgi:hypothetical protein
MTSVQTNAQPSELAEWTGTLLRCAEVRTKMLDNEGHSVPVLCMDIELDNALHTRIRIEQLFQVGHEVEAKAAAHRLKKGKRVTVQAPLIGVRLLATATHIHVHKEEATSCPA